MPGYIVTADATIMCTHGGEAKPTAQSPRVKLGGQPVVTVPGPYAISRCAYPPQSGGPCATATFVSGATRVKAGGMPVILQDSQSVAVPTGVKLNVTVTQTRVKGM